MALLFNRTVRAPAREQKQVYRTASLRWRAAALTLVLTSACAGALPAPPSRAPAAGSAVPVEVTVHQGTSMAIAVSPDRSRIVIDLQGGLWILPTDGGVARRITDEYGDARQPSWSPDGKTIAFQSYRDGTWRIWTVGADGSGLKAVTSGPFDDREPHWSPDGSRIAFSSDRSGNYDVWLLDVKTGSVTRLTQNPANDFFPSWAPDGRSIAFVSTRTPAAGVYTVTLDGVERLAAAADGAVGAPSWSPDGKLLFSVVLGPSVPGAEPPPMRERTRLVFDGQVIATGEDYFPFRAQWLSTEEFLYPADGQILRRSLRSGVMKPTPFSATLTLAPARYARRPHAFDTETATPALGIMRPVLSPDGTRVAFAALGDLWTAGFAAGRLSTPTRLTDDRYVDTDPAWSPDATAMAFASDREGGMDIWVRDLRSGAERRLTSLPDADMAPTWSPDGRWIAFISKQAYEQGEVYVVPAAGGEPRRIHERVFGAGYPSWTRDGRFVVTSALQPYSTRYREVMNYYRIVAVDGGAAQLVAPTAHLPIGKRSGDGPAISPDGRHLAFVSNDYLHVLPIGPDGRPAGPARQITTELSDSISWAGTDRILYMATDRLKLVSISDGSTSELRIGLQWRRKMPSGRLVVHAGRLIDGRRDAVLPNMDVVIERNRIVAVEPHDPARHTGAVIDAADRSVMPGLIEGHGHTLKQHGDLFGRVHLAYGVTGFRNVGANPYDALEDKEAIESGRRHGPRVFTTGYLLDGRRPYYPMASTAPTEAVVDMELDRARRLGYDMFKTYVRLPDLLQRRAIAGAHRIGIPTSSHEIYPAALSGGDSVEHTAATSRRGYSTKQSLIGRAYEDVIQIISRSGMTITPTLGLAGFQTAVSSNPAILDDPRWRLLQPPWADAALRAARGGAGAGRGLTESQRTVLALHKAGATLIAGVDSPLTPFGTALHVELQDYVAAGLTPFEAIKTATINTAMLMGAGADLGTIEAGKLADMVIVEGNPLVTIADTSRVQMVIKNGEAFTVNALLERPAVGPGTGPR